GVNAGVALAPVVAVTRTKSDTLGRVGTRTGPAPTDPNDPNGPPQINTAITGNLTVTADHRGDSESLADGSVETTGAAVGAAVAIARTDDRQNARLERSVTAGGNVTVQATGFHDDSAISRATASGESKDSTSTVTEKTDKIIEGTEQVPQPPKQVEVPPAPDSARAYFDTARPRFKDVVLLNDPDAQTKEFNASIKDEYRDALRDQAEYLHAHKTARATVFGS